MTTGHAETSPIDQATAEQLAAAFNRCFEQQDAGDGVLSDDAFFDLLPPFWRFQFEGSRTFGAQLKAIAQGPSTVRLLRVVPTATGFAMEHEETQHGEHVEVARRLWLCEVRDGQITEVLGYCNGGWDDALRARHAAEAPMLRP
jgi:hypothetical protein